MSENLWRIYYDDGSTFEGEPELAPSKGVIVIACYDPDRNRVLMSRWDWYVYRRGEGWYGCDRDGLLDNLMTFPMDFYAVKMGRTVSSPRFREILNRADAEWPHLLAA